MLILHDPLCAGYGTALRPEQPARVLRTSAHLRAAHPDWMWQVPASPVSEETLRLAHSLAHLERLVKPRDFDPDTPFFDGIGEHARRAVGAALEASRHALTTREPVFSLMRPPGHHATSDRAMGFCYLNQISLAALAARRGPESGGTGLPFAKRVAVWDFDAHHGNGTEAILHGESGIFFASVHQFPCYPGTGAEDLGPHTRNWPVAPHTPRDEHMAVLRTSLDAVIAFDPDLVLVSAGFDAYAMDPITAMNLQSNDFEVLGSWLAQTGRPTAALLEGGYSDDLPHLVDAFLSGWQKGFCKR